MKKFLPSKKFTHLILIFIGICIIVVLLSGIFSKENSFFQKKQNEATLKLTVNQLIEQDNDKDGIADWEERLWGTDPNKKSTFDNTPDNTYIENKKKLLDTGEENTENLTETDKFAREFFTAFSAMKSEAIDPETINNFSSALGQKIATPNLLDVYKLEEIKMDNSIGNQQYYSSLSTLFEKYKKAGLGEELVIVSNNLTLGSESSEVDIEKLNIITEAYKNFGKEVMETSTPEKLTQYHLDIANSSNNTGVSVANMTKMLNDPLTGLMGVSQYQKYSEDLVSAVEKLKQSL